MNYNITEIFGDTEAPFIPEGIPKERLINSMSNEDIDNRIATFNDFSNGKGLGLTGGYSAGAKKNDKGEEVPLYTPESHNREVKRLENENIDVYEFLIDTIDSENFHKFKNKGVQGEMRRKSVIDVFDIYGLDSSIENRAKIADNLGIQNYDSSSTKNGELILVMNDALDGYAKKQDVDNFTLDANEILNREDIYRYREKTIDIDSTGLKG